jgi:hypothetical protein
MSLRTFSTAALLLLAACSKSAPDPVTEAKPENRVQCAMGEAALAADCAVSRDASIFTVRHADGGFRRFEIDENGDFGSADGAEDVTGSRLSDGSVDVRIGDAHYRFTAEQLAP